MVQLDFIRSGLSIKISDQIGYDHFQVISKVGTVVEGPVEKGASIEALSLVLMDLEQYNIELLLGDESVIKLRLVPETQANEKGVLVSKEKLRVIK